MESTEIPKGVFTATSIAAKGLRHPEFIKRHLDDYTIGKLDSLQLIGLPLAIQPAYKNYLDNIAVFISATLQRRRLSTDRQFYPLTLQTSGIIPFQLPPIVVSMLRPSSKDEDKTKFRNSLPGSVTMERFTNRDIFIIPPLYPRTVDTIPIKDCDPNAPSPPEATSLLGLRTLLFTLKALTGFLATHTYPAFQTSEDITHYQNIIDVEWYQNEFYLSDPAKVKMQANNKDLLESSGIAVPSAYSITTDTITAGTKGSQLSLSGAVYYAKPAPFYPQINYGEISKIPNFPGYILPWFPALHEPSSNIILLVMRKYFFRLIQNNDKSEWSAYVQGVQKWYRTDLGKAITHILYCLQAALESQARLFIILSKGHYQGSVIQGYKFNLMYNEKILSPMNHSEIISAARELDKHSAALETLRQSVKLWKRLDNGRTANILKTEFETCRQVYTQILLREKPTVEADIEVVKQLLLRLTFMEDYIPVKADTVKQAILTILSGKPPADLKTPMYLEPDSFLTEITLAHSVLSAFGPIAPSFYDSNAPAFKIPLTGADDPLSAIDAETKKQVLDSLLISLKKTSVAASDMEIVIRKREVRMKLHERAAGYRTLRFTGKHRDEIWDLLKLLPSPGESKKRGHDEAVGESMDEDPLSPSKKSRFENFTLDF